MRTLVATPDPEPQPPKMWMRMFNNMSSNWATTQTTTGAPAAGHVVIIPGGTIWVR